MSASTKQILYTTLFIFLLIFLTSSYGFSQGTLLVKKGYKTKARFIPGNKISMEVDSMKFIELAGNIDEIGEDFIVVRGEVIAIKNIKMIRIQKGQLNYASWGINLMIGGVLYPIIYMINGALDGSRQYFSKGSIITGASLLLTGYLLFKLSYKKFDMNKAYFLRIIYMQ